jgi:hypothetical protein
MVRADKIVRKDDTYMCELPAVLKDCTIKIYGHTSIPLQQDKLQDVQPEYTNSKDTDIDRIASEAAAVSSCSASRGYAPLHDLIIVGVIERSYGQNTCWVNPAVNRALGLSRQHASLVSRCKAIAINLAITYTCNLLYLCAKLYLVSPRAALHLVDNHYDLLISLPLWARSAGKSAAAIPGICQALWDGFSILNKRLSRDKMGNLMQDGLAIAQHASNKEMMPKVQLCSFSPVVFMLLWVMLLLPKQCWVDGCM